MHDTHPIHALIARARQRVAAIDALGTTAWSLGAVGAALVLARGAQKLAPALELPWGEMLVAAPVVGVLAGLVWAALRAPDRLGAARLIDEGAGLNESLSTACVIEHADDPWSRAVVEDARANAARVDLAAAVPMRRPRGWGAPLIAGLALLGVWWLPTRDLAGMLERQEAQQAQSARVEQVRTTVESAQEKMKEIAKRTGLEIDMKNLEATEDQLDAESSEFIEPEESLRSAIKNLTEVSDKLQEKREGEDARTLDAIRNAMESLESDRDDPASEMARAMARGDFGEAKKKLDEIAEQLGEGSMSESQREAMAQQLDELKRQLEQAARNDEALREQLENAGLSEEQAERLASDPGALEKTLREMGVPASRARALADAARAQRRASDAASAMSQAAGQMAQGTQRGEPGRAAEGAESMSGQLSQLEQMQGEMQALQSAMDATQQQLDELAQCSNPGVGGQQSPGGAGRGGIQAGSGGVPNLGSPADPSSDYTLSREQAKVRVNQGGPVIASTLVYGSQVKGESSAAFASAVESASATASEAIETRRVPRKHEPAVQRYFGRLDEATRAADAPGDPDTGSGEDPGDAPDE